MLEFRFAHPWAFALLLVGAWLIWRGRWRAASASILYSDVRLTEGLPVPWRVRLARLPDWLRAAAWIFLLIALARPQSGQARDVLRGQGIDIVVALDISGSMAALDLAPSMSEAIVAACMPMRTCPNRLNVAKEVISEFVAGRSYDRVGVVAFARNAYHLVPLTLDYAVLQQLLDGVSLVTDLNQPGGEQTSLDGTAAGIGIASAAAMMRESQARSKVIILLTDGATNAGIDPVTAAEAANALGITVYAVGMGRLGDVPFPAVDGTLTTIHSDLDEDTLRRVTAAGGGTYFSATDAQALRDVASRIDRLERSPVQRQVIVPWQDQAGAWLAFAVAALLLERLLRLTVFVTVP